MSNEIPDFNESEPRLVAVALKERYGEDIETQLTLLMVQGLRMHFMRSQVA
jgi:hypothetical protein